MILHGIELHLHDIEFYRCYMICYLRLMQGVRWCLFAFPRAVRQGEVQAGDR